MNLFVLPTLAAAGPALRMAKHMTSNMVVPAEAPTFTGWASAPGKAVTARASTGQTASASSDNTSAFTLVLPARPASLEAFSVNVSEAGGATMTLSNLLAGDVWVCSGQSNMEFSIAEMFGAEQVIREAGQLPGLRLFAVQKNASAAGEEADLIEAQYAEGWVDATTETVCGAAHSRTAARFCEPHCGPSAVVSSFKRDTWGFFSAACYVHGLQLLRATGRPQGLLETCWGGTPIEAWSSPVALAKCNGDGDGDKPATPSEPQEEDAELGEAATSGPSSLWNSMVAPLLGLPIRGALWYQGEANARNGNKYACQLRAMIGDWRTRFAALPPPDAERSGGQGQGAASPFVFTTVQIAASGGDGTLRLAQAASLSLPRTALAVTTDLYDAHSPCGSVHTRHKNETGIRAARASLAIGYGHTSLAWRGPVPRTIKAGQGGEVSVVFDAAGALAFASVPNQTTVPADQNFEATSDTSLVSGWKRVPATVLAALPLGSNDGAAAAAADTVRVDASSLGAAVAGLRFNWPSVPLGQQLYDGGGREAGLPAGPFLARCGGGVAGECELVVGGEVPVGGVVVEDA